MENNPSRITICYQKGGIGKSIFTTLLASYLHYTLCYSVLIVDCDYPQRSIYAQRERELAATVIALLPNAYRGLREES